jgi:hypothetical protein
MRYYVTGGGLLGTNSDYIGIDRFQAAAGPAAYRVGGSVDGVTGAGLVLWLNGQLTLPVAADGTFTFDGVLDPGTPYSVSARSQPTGQTCAVTSGTGTIPSANVSGVQVTCTAIP